MKTELQLVLTGADLLNPDIVANAKMLLELANKNPRIGQTQIERQAQVRAARESFCSANKLNWQKAPACVADGREAKLRARIESERGFIDWDLLDVRANVLLEYGYDLRAVREVGGEGAYFDNGRRAETVEPVRKNFGKPKI